jgi:hypothetical protein
MITTILAAYGAVALLIAAHGLVHHTGRRPHERWMTALDRAALGLAAIAVGALWIAFVPALLFHVGRGRAVAGAPRGWRLSAPGQVHARP